MYLWEFKVPRQANLRPNYTLIINLTTCVSLSIDSFIVDVHVLHIRVGILWGKCSFHCYYSFKNTDILSWYHKLTLWNINRSKHLAISLTTRKIPKWFLVITSLKKVLIELKWSQFQSTYPYLFVDKYHFIRHNTVYM